MAKVRIRKEDQVYVISGKDRDLERPRRVLQVLPRQQRVLVEGANIIKRHTRPNPQRNIKGGIVERESPIHVSNKSPRTYSDDAPRAGPAQNSRNAATSAGRRCDR